MATAVTRENLRDAIGECLTAIDAYLTDATLGNRERFALEIARDELNRISTEMKGTQQDRADHGATFMRYVIDEKPQIDAVVLERISRVLDVYRRWHTSQGWDQ